jgi:hypothetical protein
MDLCLGGFNVLLVNDVIPLNMLSVR